MRMSFDIDGDGDIFFKCPECLKYVRDATMNAEVIDGQLVYRSKIEEGQILKCRNCGAEIQLDFLDPNDVDFSDWKVLNPSKEEE